ncbi:hypothetical protein CsSME_00032532 [Camellia sinensis var. sinensis]
MHKSRSKSAIIIQSHIRGWIARQEATRVRYCIIVIQSYWKGYLAQKASRGQLLDLCLRLHKSAANVDDSMRIINRLLVALSDLLSIKSVSGILHTCATLGEHFINDVELVLQIWPQNIQKNVVKNLWKPRQLTCY